MSNINDELNLIHSEAVSMMDKGDFNSAFQIASKMKKYGPNPMISNALGGLLIDIGVGLNNEEITAEGLTLLKKDYKAIIDMDVPIESVCYNIANGYASLFRFEYNRNKTFYLFRTTELDVAMCYNRTAIKYNKNNPQLSIQLFTNLANCLDHKGRVMEALEYYDKALSIDPEFSMTLANKGLALYNYVRLTGQMRLVLIKSYSLLSEAIGKGVLPESEKSFRFIMEFIENLFEDKEKLNTHLKASKYEIEAESEIEKFLIEYCMENKLYLNECTVCQRCSKSIGDTFRIKSMSINLSQIDIENLSVSNPFYRLSAYLNQIKQDYITARFLLILSRYQKINLDFVDKNVGIVNTLDYDTYNVYVQLLKFSFKNLFDILDKIAFFINDYLELGINEGWVNFSNIWYSDKKKNKIYENILKTENPNLNALFDINKDFDTGPYQKLKKIRNALTHRFIKVKMFNHLKTEDDITEEDLVENTLELCKIVRNSIFYLLNFVNMEEQKKKKNDDKPKINPIIVENIPDKLKSDRY